MILEFVGFIMAFAYKTKLEDVYGDGLASIFDKALNKNDTKVIMAFHELEKGMECCGAKGKSDYSKHGIQPPDFCFQPKTSKGCSQAIIDIFEKNLPIIGGVLGAVLAIELVGLICSIMLRAAIGKASGEVYSSNPSEVLADLVPGRRRNYRTIK